MCDLVAEATHEANGKGVRHRVSGKERMTFVTVLRNLVNAINNLVAAVRSNTDAVRQLVGVLDVRPVKLKLHLEGGTNNMADVQEGLLIGASDMEFNAEGDAVPAADPTQLTYAVDDPTVAKVLMTADDPTIPVGQARVQGLKVGTCNVTSTDNALTPPLTSDPVQLNVTLDPVAKKLVVTLA